MKNFINLLLLMTAWSSVSRADQPSTHGMLLFGNQATYASHLPMFHHPHDYQVLLKLSLVDHGSDTLAKYEAEKQKTTDYFTLVPEVMDLSKVISGEKVSFLAEVYLGHFERGGKLLGSIEVKVDKVIFANQLDENLKSDANKYLVFGEQGEYFAAHLIEGKPNVDAILKVDYFVVQQPCHKRLCPEVEFSSPPKNPITLESSTVIPNVGGLLGDLSAHAALVEKLIYVEKGDLAN